MSVLQYKMHNYTFTLFFRWLQKEATVVSTEIDADPENIIVNMYISTENFQKFLAKFSNRKLNSNKPKARDFSS